MHRTNNSSAAADWHMYFDGASAEDLPDQPRDHFAPKAGYAYQHDAVNDEFHSTLTSAAAASLLAQVKAGKTLDPARLLHFTDEHAPTLAALLQCPWLATPDDNAKEVIAFAAYRHHADFENPAIAAHLLAHLYGMGASQEDIVAFIENTDELEDDAEFMKLLDMTKQQASR